MRNPFYCGKIEIKEWKDEPSEIVNGNHEAIISKDLFERVQDRFRKRNKKSAKPSKFNESFPLRGHLKCKQCEGNLTASSSTGRNKKYHYYHCQNGCKERFSSSEANAIFVEMLNGYTIDSTITELYVVILIDVFQKNEGSKSERIKLTQKRIEKSELQLKKLDSMLLSDSIQLSDYQRMSKDLKDDVTRLEAQKCEVECQDTNLDKHFHFGITMMTHLNHYYDIAPIEMKHKIIDSIFPEKLVFDGEKYRTDKMNTFVSLIASGSKALEGINKKQAAENYDLSNLAPPPGLEPGTY